MNNVGDSYVVLQCDSIIQEAEAFFEFMEKRRLATAALKEAVAMSDLSLDEHIDLVEV